MTEDDQAGAAPVLAAVDFSEESRAALVWAARQARLEQAPLVVLHVVHGSAEKPGLYDTQHDGQLTPLLDAAEEKTAAFVAATQSGFPDETALAEAEIRLVSGLPAGRICEVAKECNARLVAVGNVGRSALQSMLLGSVAGGVAQGCPMPVVVVKALAEGTSE